MKKPKIVESYGSHSLPTEEESDALLQEKWRMDDEFDEEMEPYRQAQIVDRMLFNAQKEAANRPWWKVW